MITKTIVVDGAEVAINDGYRKINTAYGLSSDIKPVEGFKNADRFLEFDTKKVYLFDEQNKAWLPLGG
jgi:hypothetical protein